MREGASTTSWSRAETRPHVDITGAGDILTIMSDQRSYEAAERARYDARHTDAFDTAGVDVTLIDWMLSLTPKQRLDALFDYASSTARLLPRDGSD
jgi:hypothetical protein